MSEPTVATPTRFRTEVVERAAGAATLIAAVLYGYGWLVLAQFYGAFDVNPEDVGVTFAFVTVRIALVMAVVAVVVAAVLLPLRALARMRLDGSRLPGMDTLTPVRDAQDFAAQVRADARTVGRRDTDWSSLAPWMSVGRLVGTGVGALLLFLLVVGLGTLALRPFGVDTQRLGENPAGGALSALVLFGGPLVVVLLVVAVRYVYERIRRGPISLRRFARVVAYAVAVALVLAFLAGIWLLPRTMADRVRSTDLGADVPFLRLIGLRADSVQVAAADGGPVSPRLGAGCVRLLGSANGVTVLFDPATQVLVRVPTESVVLERPCR